MKHLKSTTALVLVNMVITSKMNAASYYKKDYYRHPLKVEPAINRKLVTCPWLTLKKTRNHKGLTPEPTIWSRDTGQGKPCFDSCQLTTAWMCNNRLEAWIRLPH